MFHINEHGTREGVSKHIKDLKPVTGEGVGKEDAEINASQLEAAKAFILAEIASLPRASNGVHVVAEGNAHAGARVFSANVMPKQFKV